MLDQGGSHFVEGGGVLMREDGRLRGEPVLQGVEGAACLGARSGGAAGVEAVGSSLFAAAMIVPTGAGCAAVRL